MTWMYDCPWCGSDIVPEGRERSRVARLVPMDQRPFYIYGTCPGCGSEVSISEDHVPGGVRLALPERRHTVGRPSDLDRVAEAPEGRCWVRNVTGAMCKNPLAKTTFQARPRLRCCTLHRRLYERWLRAQGGQSAGCGQG